MSTQQTIATVNAYLLPPAADACRVNDATVVVIDVLRASTTIIHALAEGAKEIVPCLEVEEARRVASELGPRVLLGGERGGRRIDGFDLGNSPSEYPRETVENKIIAFTTTNGTRAMMACRQARRVLIGAFVNLSALCRELASANDVALVCAGTQGEVTREDVLCAGFIADKIRASQPKVEMNDQARIAIDAASAIGHGFEGLAEALRNSQGGRNLASIGQDADIEFAAEVDSHRVVGELSLKRWRIHSATTK